MTATLCETFQDLAAETWQRLEAAYAMGMRWSEESNTEHLLLSLRTRHAREIAIAAFSKQKEARNGADWEWWFIGPAGAYGMRVQAKRIKLPSEIFSHLYYKNQMTSLIQGGINDGLTPAYCFYVASTQLTPNSNWPPAIVPKPTNITGCLIGHAQSVEAAQSNTLGSLGPCLMPWHFLVCPGADIQADVSLISEAAMTRLSQHQLTIAPTIMRTEAECFLSDRRDLPPEYVTEFLQPGVRIEGLADRALGEAGAAERGIRGIVVVDSRGSSYQ